MKKEELEMGVFVPPKQEIENIPGTLAKARETLCRVVAGTVFLPATHRENTENGDAAPAAKFQPENTQLMPGKDLAFPAVGLPIPSLVRGEILPGNPVFSTAGETGKAMENAVLEQVSLELSDQRDAYVAGMEATLKIQQEILRAILNIQIGDETIARANERYVRKMAVAEGGVL